jgi:4-amino-4-deoxy-L-arabinose transferase-like glycosyltransferase
VLFILLFAALLRFHALALDVRFHPDEALFTTFARTIWTTGDASLAGDLDKPPLSIYANALSLAFIAATYERGVPDFDARVGEFAARLPSTFASLIQIAAVCALTKRLYGAPLARWAALFLALSPLAIAYAPGAYTDGLMHMFAALALWMSAARRPLWAGIWLALAFACKQQAMYYAPLCIALLTFMPGVQAVRLKRGVLLWRLVAPVVIGVGVLLVWDFARAPSPSMFVLAAANNTPSGLVTADDLVPRLNAWLTHVQFMLGAPTLLLGIVIPIAVIEHAWGRVILRETRADLILLGFTLGYLLAHWWVAFNTYDRYLLVIVPSMGVLGARAGAWLWRVLRRAISQPEMMVAAGALLLSMLSGAINAASGETAYNGERRQYAGIIALADYIAALPTATVIYDHWSGWQLGYYLGAWHDKRRVYYPTPDALVSDALVLPENEPRYFVAPSSVDAAVWLDALRAAGFAVERSYAAQGYVGYRVLPP